MQGDYISEAKIFKAFCDEKRLLILELLKAGEKCVCALIDEIDLPQSTLSYHMKILCESGAVIGRQEGKWTHYSINKQGIHYAAEILKTFAVQKTRHQKNTNCCVSTR
jgi:ArsR family transcriptional regulator